MLDSGKPFSEKLDLIMLDKEDIVKKYTKVKILVTPLLIFEEQKAVFSDEFFHKIVKFYCNC